MLADISIDLFLSSKYNARWFCGRVVSVLAYETGKPSSNPGSGLNGYCSSSVGLDWIIGEVMARTKSIGPPIPGGDFRRLPTLNK